MRIPFNVPASLGNEPELVRQAMANGHISGNGPFTKKVHAVFEQEFGFPKVFLTHSCTGALEMAALLLRLQPGDEVILPSFTHVGTANAFERAGATLRFADSLHDHPNIDPAEVERLVTPRTKAVVVVHYAGVVCEMDTLQEICHHNNLVLIEDAAHAIASTYKARQAGSFGAMAAFSFHETKNINCGQGGLLVLNDLAYADRAAVLWENGTNRAAFFAGLVDQYTWVDTGSCFLPSDLNAAYLYGQLVGREELLSRRMELWAGYDARLRHIARRNGWEVPTIPAPCTHNAHIYYLLLPDRGQRDALLESLRAQGILGVFHYVPLHSSPHFAPAYGGPPLYHCQRHSDRIVRLPLYHSLKPADLDAVCAAVENVLTSLA